MKFNFVSRAGFKLQYALDEFKLDISNLICADFGSSTGGFVDCILQNGAAKVYSIDTSYGELDWNLRNDKRVEVLERTNAMHVILPESMDLITIDVAWTKQEKVLPNAINNLKSKGLIISLIKPHYEADKKLLQKGKLPEDEVDEVISEVETKISKLGLKVVNKTKSPIVGKRAENVEWLYLLQISNQ